MSDDMKGNWIYLAKNKFTQSGAVGVNFLFNEGNIYIYQIITYAHYGDGNNNVLQMKHIVLYI